MRWLSDHVQSSAGDIMTYTILYHLITSSYTGLLPVLYCLYHDLILPALARSKLNQLVG